MKTVLFIIFNTTVPLQVPINGVSNVVVGSSWSFLSTPCSIELRSDL